MSLSPGAKAALAIWGAAIVWDVVCPEGQTFSEAVERGLNNRRTEIPVTLLILATAAHLLRTLSPRYDPYTVVFRQVGRIPRPGVSVRWRDVEKHLVVLTDEDDG